MAEPATRCPERIYLLEGDYAPCLGTPSHAGSHWSGSWRWIRPNTAIDQADYEPYGPPEE